MLNEQDREHLKYYLKLTFKNLKVQSEKKEMRSKKYWNRYTEASSFERLVSSRLLRHRIKSQATPADRAARMDRRLWPHDATSTVT